MQRNYKKKKKNKNQLKIEKKCGRGKLIKIRLMVWKGKVSNNGKKGTSKCNLRSKTKRLILRIWRFKIRR